MKRLLIVVSISVLAAASIGCDRARAVRAEQLDVNAYGFELEGYADRRGEAFKKSFMRFKAEYPQIAVVGGFSVNGGNGVTQYVVMFTEETQPADEKPAKKEK